YKKMKTLMCWNCILHDKRPADQVLSPIKLLYVMANLVDGKFEEYSNGIYGGLLYVFTLE
ncbi:hypothetical protein ACI394_29075, partial [Klebsiella pneumoniae]|uniref:hypothetical protein n=1 Tax=Klebsiella pneumoniae TaxID=573 RepID=UPI0038549B84